ncbi:hypothetical protein SLS62_006386 [Diatrype stigma]|uniref:F-box domain-containing protein n=1 Tax=Diatrype stigma TaxID=117547 RepID=A0AAN9UNB4_9PEZI
MESLPVELKAIVAGFSPDPQSLVNLALSCKTFYSIIRRDEDRVRGNICHRKFGSEFLPLAIAVLESGQLLGPRRIYGELRQLVPDATVENVVKFIDLHFPDEYPARLALNHKDCMALFRFDGIVDTYATAIAEEAVQKTPGGGTSFMGITETETTRIRKSLYLTELDRNLFLPDYNSPGALVGHNNTAYEPAWQHLLTKFAPWELQQLPCTKVLLAQYVQKVMASDAANQKQKQPHNNAINNIFLRAFVGNEGLAALSAMEGLANGDTNLDATAVLAKYPELESGLRDGWLHTMLQNFVDEDMFGQSSTLCFSCDFHAAEWGWAFWDRARLNIIARGTLPIAEQMLSVGNVQVTTR